MLPVVTTLAPRGIRSACSRAVTRTTAAARGAVRATGSHIDGDHGDETRSQAQCRCSAAPAAVWDGRGRVEGAARRPGGEDH
jgi:hypothetical protein